MTMLINFLTKNINLNLPVWLISLFLFVVITFVTSTGIAIHYFKNKDAVNKVRMERSVESLNRIDGLLDDKITNESDLSKDIQKVIDILLVN